MPIRGSRRSVPTVLIRPAELQDAEAIALVHVQSWQAAYRGLLPQHVLDGLSVERRAASWRSSLSSPDSQTLVAVDPGTGRVGGFVNVGPSRDDDSGPDVGELRAIYVAEEWWSAGTGRRLHDAGLRLLCGTFGEATLWVLDSNERGHAPCSCHYMTLANLVSARRSPSAGASCVA